MKKLVGEIGGYYCPCPLNSGIFPDKTSMIIIFKNEPSPFKNEPSPI
jgi:hypothetical protein